MAQMAEISEQDFLRDLAESPGGHCRKIHYFFKRETRKIYAIVWFAWLKGLCTCPLFEMRITDRGLLRV